MKVESISFIFMASLTTQQSILKYQTYYENGPSIKKKLYHTNGAKFTSCVNLRTPFQNPYKIQLTQELKPWIMDRWHYWTGFLWKWSWRDRYGEFWTLSWHVNWIFVAEIEWIECDWALGAASREAIALIATKFGDRIISRNSEENRASWPRWIIVFGATWKAKCMLMFHEQFNTLNAKFKLKLFICIKQRTITMIISLYEVNQSCCFLKKDWLLQKIIENFDVRMMACKRSRDGHLNNIIFHTKMA